jgi:small subunit ribosomal protein S17
VSTAEEPQKPTGRRKQREGTVVSNKMDKTVVVVVARLVRHGKYHKYLTQRVKYKAHDQQNKCRVGDRVRLIETRPLSRDKRWAVQAILGRDEGAGEPLVGTTIES